MVVYVEVVALINFIFDASIILTVDLVLKRGIRLKRVILGALVGELSMLTIVFNMNPFYLFLFKIMLSFLMCIASFGYKDAKYSLYNVVHMYFIGIILGGFITFLFNEFQLNRAYSFRYIIVLILSPIILLIYYRITRQFKNNYNNRYKIVLKYNEERLEGVGFLDSGNKLVSPISGKPIILVEKEYINLHKLKLLPVPYNALNHHGIIECFKPDYLSINGKVVDEVLIGVSDVKFHIDGVNVLLNARMEGL